MANANTNTIEKFIKSEEVKLNRLDKFFGNYPVIYFSKDVKVKIQQNITDRNITIKPSKILRIIAFLFICFGLFFWINLLLLVVQNVLTPIALILLLFTTCWIAFIIWTFFLNPKYSYKIIFNKTGIVIDKQQIQWERISEYLLMEKNSGRHLKSTLVLFIDDNSIKQSSLENLNTSGKKILKLIELYKS